MNKRLQENVERIANNLGDLVDAVKGLSELGALTINVTSPPLDLGSDDEHRGDPAYEAVQVELAALEKQKDWLASSIVPSEEDLRNHQVEMARHEAHRIRLHAGNPFGCLLGVKGMTSEHTEACDDAVRLLVEEANR